MRCGLPASARMRRASRPPTGSSASRTSPTSSTRDLPPWGGAAPTDGCALTGADALQIGDEVPPLVRILDAAEGHAGPRHDRERRGDVAVEQRLAPGAVLGREGAHGGRVLEALLGRDPAPDDADEARTLQDRGLVRVDGVAGIAILEHALAAACVAAGGGGGGEGGGGERRPGGHPHEKPGRRAAPAPRGTGA